MIRMKGFILMGVMLLLACPYSLSAQSLKNYRIIYEKRVNVNKLYPRWATNTKEDKFHKEHFLLTTNSERSFYERKEKDITEKESYLSSFMAYSQTYIDIVKRTQVSQKEVGEKTFLMKDSIPSLTWYLQDETRSIAGYTCRKAIAKYADSIVIVAYFTEQLEAPVGPESVNGLPGTILGMVIPRLHTTWLATSVESLELKPVIDYVQPRKGELVTKSTLFDIVKKVYKDYDNLYSIIYRVIL